MAGWETWAQVAGIGGFALGAYNLIYGLREPVRARQREVRRELLALLYDIQDEWLKITSDLAREDVPLPTDAPRTRASLSRLLNYSMLLKYPTPADFQVMNRDLDVALRHLRTVRQAGTNPPNAKHIDKLGPTGVLLARLMKAIDIISKKEQGSLRRPRAWPDYPAFDSYRQ